MDTEGKVRFPDPAGNGSEFLFRRRVQQRLLRASASLRENCLFLLSFSIPTSPSRSPAEAQGCGELSGFSMETGRFPPSVFNGVEKSAAQRGKRWQVIFRFPRPFPSGIRKLKAGRFRRDRRALNVVVQDGDLSEKAGDRHSENAHKKDEVDG